MFVPQQERGAKTSISGEKNSFTFCGKIFFSISSGMLGEIHGKFKSSPHEYWCLSNRDMREKDLEHCEQLYFLTTECV